MDYLLGSSLVAFSLGGVMRLFTHYEDSVVEDIASVTYKDFIETVETGDLLLTSTTDISSVTRAFTNSLWSHCGIAYWGTDPKTGEETLYEWSAHREGENVRNSKGEFGCGGPQLVPLDYLASMYGSVFWRRVEMKEEQREAVDKSVAALCYKIRFSAWQEFLVYFGQPFASVFDGVGGGMACSHLVAATYAGAGVLDLNKELSRYTPKSFSDIGDALWKTNVGSIKMVVGYDATKLIEIV